MRSFRALAWKANASMILMLATKNWCSFISKSAGQTVKTSVILFKITYASQKFVQYCERKMIRRCMGTLTFTPLPAWEPIYRLYQTLHPLMDLNLANATGKIAQCRLQLSEYEFDVVPQPGV